MRGALKVLGKSLKAVLDEVNFMVNLYSSPLPPVPQPNPSYPQVSHLYPFQAEQIPKLSSPLHTSKLALVCIFSSILLQRARSLVVGDLRSETKGSRFEFGCYLCAEVNSLQ